MSDSRSVQTAAGLNGRAAWHQVRVSLGKPALVFALLSALFGTLTVILTSPLSGPDEAAHFLRAYGLSRGEILPATTDDNGHKGLVLPTRIYLGFVHHRAMSEYLRRNVDPAQEHSDGAPGFIPYRGSEGYAPVSYLPYIGAALVARLVDLDFLGTLYLMRFAGLAATTAVIAYAIGVVPQLSWAFMCIAMLPASIYGRSVVSADGGALAYVMAITALCLRGAGSSDPGRPFERSLWMALCVLVKPPQLAFVLLELIRRPFRDLPRMWRPIALVILPGALLGVAWAAVSSGDTASWRLTEGTDLAPEQFELGWKLGYMLHHPLHFPTMLIGSVQDLFELWRQLIGILGWLDSALLPWVYPAASAILVATFPTRLEIDRETRKRIALVAALIVLGYILAVFLIFYLAWTPMETDRVEGVQGRYFIVALPAVALFLSALLNRGLPRSVLAFVAIFGALLFGGATIEAILRADWKLW